MQPHKLTVNDVFEKERRYVIPLYQRAYVWNREDQWEPLWGDIKRSAEECSSGADEEVRPHFLGAVVWSLSRIVGKAVPRAEVIDGQQRLTTLQLFLAAYRNIASEVGADVADVAMRWTTNPVRDKTSDELFKVWPSNADRETFRAVMTAPSKEALRGHFQGEGRPSRGLPRMAEAYFYFDQSIRNFMGESADEDERIDRLDSISQALRAALQFVVIELEQGDDPQIIFETLNARGQPLLPSDLIRNFVFVEAASLGASESDRLYDKYWRAFDDRREEKTDAEGEDRFWHMQERQGRLTRPRIDLFMFHYLTVQSERELNISQLFREFRDWEKRKKPAIEDLLSDLKGASERFAQLIQPTGNSRLSTLATRLHALDTSTVYPLLLFVTGLGSAQLPEADRTQIYADLESYLTRRFICGLTTKNYNKFFLAVLVKAKRAAAEGGSVAQAVRDELARSADPTAIWPRDDEFERAWLSKPLYVKSRPDRAVAVLHAIESGMRTTRNEALALPDDLTVEHLLPQRGSVENYPFAAVLPIEGSETPEQCRARLIHTIGNLTLLTSALNASVSNGPFSGKTAAIGADSDLRLNAWLRQGAPSSWSEAEVLERGKRLFAQALMIWPRPAIEACPAATEKSGVRQSFTERLAALMKAKALTDGEALTLNYKGQTFTAAATGAGIKLADGVYSPSEAAKRCYRQVGSGRLSENGWRAWRNSRGVTLRDLLAEIGDDLNVDEDAA